MRRHRFANGCRTLYAEPVTLPDEDDVSTWPNTATITTMTLPGTSGSYFLLFDITSQLDAGAVSDTDSLRFVHDDGTKLGHFRTDTDRIFVAGTFAAGLPITLHVYWGKAAQTQPGDGFPSSTDVMAAFDTFVIVEASTIIDYAADPATFTETGAVTYGDGYLGRLFTLGDGIYVSTTATKLTSGGRTKRNCMMLTHITQSTTVPQPLPEARCAIWGKWTTNTRSFQLWIKTGGCELYVDDNGTSPYTTWTAWNAVQSGRNFIGCSWRASDGDARVQMNDYVYEGARDNLSSPLPGNLYDASPLPFILGGTSINGFNHPGSIEAYFETHADLTADQMKAFFWAWAEHDIFFVQDRTPANLDVIAQSGVSVSTEVEFPTVKINRISPDTAISVSGNGTPTYSIGSTDTAVDDVRAKSSTPSTVSDGQYVTTYHTSSHLNSTSTVSYLTVGTVTSERESITVASSGGTTPPIPEGTADVTVDNIPDLLTAFAAATAGQIIELEAGDYTAYGQITFQNKNNVGGAPIVVRASTRPWDGYLGSGLVVNDETAFEVGSGGADLGRVVFSNLDNIVFDGFRGHAVGYYYDANAVKQHNNAYIWEGVGVRDCVFRYCYLSSEKPSGAESTWGPTDDAADDWWWLARGFGLGVRSAWSSRCERIKIQHCAFRYLTFPLAAAKMYNSLVEWCFFTDNRPDHMRNDGDNADTIIRNNVFGRLFPMGSTYNIEHPDCVQDTAKSQACLLRNTLANNIISVGDSQHGKMQGFFIEQDGYPAQQEPRYNLVENNLFFATSGNTIYFRPSNSNTIRNNTIIADFHTGQAPDANCMLIVNAQSLSFGNNTVTRNVHDGVVSVGVGDVNTQNTHLTRATYGQHLVNYSEAGTACRLYNPYNCTLTLSEVARLAPRANSALHTNQTGYDLGCVKLFRDLGVLP